MKNDLLTLLRDRSISLPLFRSTTHSLAALIASEVASKLSQEKIILIPILRAGLALLPAFQSLFPNAPIGFFGIYREKSNHPRLYYENLPAFPPSSRVILLDPMLATGGSALLSLNQLKQKGVSQITLVSLIAAQEGLTQVKKAYPKVDIYTVAVDPHLNAQKFIVPGLGDFGDRYFGTIEENQEEGYSRPRPQF